MRHFTANGRWLLASTFAAVLTVGCGGGSGGGGSSSSSDDDSSTDNTTTSASEFSGTVTSPDGQTVGTRTPLEWGQDMLASLLSAESQAATTGLAPVPADTQVALVRLNSDGSIAETLETTTTDSQGQYTITADAELTGELAVFAGTGADRLRAPASGAGSDINPISESIVRKVVERVNSGTSTFSDYTATELATLVGIILDEIKAAGVDFSGQTVSDSVNQVDTTSGSTSDELIAESEGDSGIDFTGVKNFGVLGVELEGNGDPEAFLTGANQSGTVEVTSAGEFDLVGHPHEEVGINRRWDFDTSGTGGSLSNYAFTPEQFSTDAFTEDEVPVSDVTITSAGRLAITDVSDGGSLRGAVSADGELFAASNTDDNAFAHLMLGANQWSPGDISQKFNVVRFEPYLDESDQSADVSTYLPGNAGFGATLRSIHDVTCTSGDCAINVTRDLGADTRKFYWQNGPEGDLRAGNSTFLGDFTLNPSLTSKGRLKGGGDDLSSHVTRGFIAKDAQMLVMQQSGPDTSGGYPFQTLYVGLPQGSSCGKTVFNGSYRFVALEANSDRFTQTATGSLPGSFNTKTSTFTISADGAGEWQFEGASNDSVDLDMLDGNPMTSREIVGDDPEAPAAYAVNSDCTLEFEDDTTNNNFISGAISPDGERVVLVSFDWNADNRTPSDSAQEAFGQLLVGFRAP